MPPHMLSTVVQPPGPDMCVSEYNKERLIISFDSSAWLFMYHFGVAMFIEDHIDHRLYASQHSTPPLPGLSND